MSRGARSPEEPASPKRIAVRREDGPGSPKRVAVRREGGPSGRRRVPVRAGIAAGAILLLLLAAFWFRASRGPQPPRLADLGAMDPDVASLIGQQIDEVAAARTDPNAWFRLGLACEANGFTGAAAQAFETATALDPGNPRSWYRL